MLATNLQEIDVDIQATLDALDTQEQQALFTLLAFRFQKKTAVYTTAETELWDAIGTAMGKHERERRALSAFLNGFNGSGGYGRARYADAISLLEAVLNKALPALTRKPVRMQVRVLILRSLVRYLTQIDVPVTEKTILNNFGILEHAVNQTYPGYIAARLLHRIAMQPVSSAR